jgi:spore germination protein KA
MPFSNGFFRKIYNPADKLRTRFSLGNRQSTLDSRPIQNENSSVTEISPNPQTNVQHFEELFFGEKNKDFVKRRIEINFQGGKTEIAWLIFLKGISDDQKIEELILKPLLRTQLSPTQNSLEIIMNTILPTPSTSKSRSVENVKTFLTRGQAALFIPYEKACILIEVSKTITRAIEDARDERTIRGPHEGFTEGLELNVALLRTYLRTNYFVTEMIEHKSINQSRTAIIYLENIANPKLVEEVKKRLNNIDVDYLLPTGVLQQLIEDEPRSLIPTLTVTERPDRAAGMLLDGHVIVLSERSPFALICPTTFWTLFHTSDEVFLRTPYANFIRLIRISAILFALLTPGVYIAFTNYQPELIPTDLLLHIAGSRETLPFPTFLEIIIMEGSFELIREAGIRIPAVIGSTIGIVGALILGQAAVQANIISPILVILVSVTGLGSFAIPNQDLSFTIRIGRFIFFFFGTLLGIFGIAYAFILMLIFLVSHQSFGVPFLAPLAPRMKSNHDFIFRSSLWKERLYSQHTRPKKKERTKNKTWVYSQPEEDKK